MDLPKASTLGTRLRLLRKRLGVTLDEFSQKTGISRNAISRAERDAIRQINPRVLQQLLRQLSGRLKEAFPNGDPFEFVIPSNTLGGWIRNQRLRRGMAQKQLAKSLGVHPFSVVRYERNSTTPDSSVQQRLKGILGNGFERFLNRATISAGTSGQPTSAVGRSESSGHHEEKKQAVTEVQVRGGRS